MSNVLMKLQEALDEEVILEDQILTLMHHFVDRFTDRRVEINNLMVLQDRPLIDYGKYALGCMTGADMKKCVHLKSVRDELIRTFGWHLEEINMNLAHLEKKRTRLRFYTKSFKEIVHTERGDGVAINKRRRHDFHIDDVTDLATASERSRLKVDLESSTW
ncbi:hypothetical protein Tco_1127047 [Tanacetum coccineum]